MLFFCKKQNQNFLLNQLTEKMPEVYRNFYTSIPPRDLLADLLPDPQDRKNLESMIHGFSGIDKDEPPHLRAFSYANAFPEISKEQIFNPFRKGPSGNYGFGRFGDGLTYGVFYSALDLETSRKEVIYHALNDFNTRRHEMLEEEFVRDRKMIRIGFEGTFLDLIGQEKLKNELISVEYDTCRELAIEARKNGYAALRVPSARSDGVCLPIFDEKSLYPFSSKASFVYNFKIVIKKNNPTEVIVENNDIKTYQSSDFGFNFSQ